MERPINKFMYHPEHGKRLVKGITEDKYQELLDAGYYDSPADFPQVSESPDENSSSNTELQGADAGETQAEPVPETQAEPEDGSTDLLDRFEEDPKSLTKDEHVALGKSLGIHLIKSWKEDTLIAKIQAKIQGE